MIFYNMPNDLFYILISLIVSSSILLYFLSKKIITQEKIKKNYEVERNTCKFKYLTKKDKYIIYGLEEKLHLKSDRKERRFKYKDFSTVVEIWEKMKRDNYVIKYKLEVKGVDEFLYYKLGG